jgi:hypothetical protein
MPSILDRRRVRGEGSMQSSKTYVVAVTALVAGALVPLGCGASHAAKSKPVVVKVSQAAPAQPVRLRYYGGPKSPMSP